MDDDPEVRSFVYDEISANRISWEQFVYVGSRHFVLPALFSAIKRNGLLQFLPAELTEHLEYIYELNLTRNKQIIEQANNLIQLFSNQNIDLIFLKGAGHLLQGIYHNSGDRIMSDIDILVSEHDIEKASNVLYEKGYYHSEESNSIDYSSHHHLPGFEHNSYIAMVELHKAVIPLKYAHVFPIDSVFATKTKIEGIPTYVLSTTHQMMLNFIHNQLNDQEFVYKAMSLKGIYDFYLLSKLDTPGQIKPKLLNYNSKFNTYCYFVSTVFNCFVSHEINYVSKRYKKQFDFLQNNPKIKLFLQFTLLYFFRIRKIIHLLIIAPFSKKARKFIHKQFGTRAARKQLYSRMKEELKGN